MDGFVRYAWHRLLFNALFYGHRQRPDPRTHNAIAVPKLANVIVQPTENHSMYRAKCTVDLHGVETTISVIADSQQHALNKLSKALKLEKT